MRGEATRRCKVSEARLSRGGMAVRERGPMPLGERSESLKRGDMAGFADGVLCP